LTYSVKPSSAVSRKLALLIWSPAGRSNARRKYRVAAGAELAGSPSGYQIQFAPFSDADAALAVAPYGSGPWDSSVGLPGAPEPLLRKDFTAGKTIASARAYISGLGYYKLYVNGQRIGDHELDPAFTIYDKTDLYATYDVTGALHPGANAVGVILGRGYFGMTNPGDWLSSPWHSEPKLKLELDITYRDGSTQHVLSDAGWKVTDGPTRTDSVMAGETYDARLEQPGWTRPGFDDTD